MPGSVSLSLDMTVWKVSSAAHKVTCLDVFPDATKP